jgi:hypothetical protein
VSSQKLRHLEVLLRDPWKVPLPSVDEAQVKTSLPIQVANATAFIVQKLLICDKREKDELAKDILYIHDTIEVFGAKLDRLNELWPNSVRPKFIEITLQRLWTLFQSYFQWSLTRFVTPL